MRGLALVLGVLGVLLGGLWVLQGLGVVHLRPILCFADCAPVQGPSPVWVAIGSFLLLVGGLSQIVGFAAQIFTDFPCRFPRSNSPDGVPAKCAGRGER